MSRLAGLLSAVGSGVLGYQKGLRQFKDDEEQAAERTRKAEEYAYNKGERDRATKLRADLANSQVDTTVGAATDTGATYTDAALIDQDNRENAKFSRQAADNTGQPAIEVPAIKPTNYTAGDQAYDSKGAADFAVGGINSRAEKARRAGAVMQASGDIANAEKYYQMAKTIQQEGVLEAAGAIRALAPKPEQLYDADKKPISQRHDIDPAIIDTLNKTGSGAIKLPPGAYAEHYPVLAANGTPMTETRILSKDGKVLAENLGQTLRGMQSFMDQYKITKDDQDGSMKLRELDEKREDNKATRRIQQQNADTNAGYRADQAENMRAQRRLQEQGIEAKGPGAAPVWDEKADTFLKSRYTAADPVSGEVKVDGNGLMFAKSVALSRARANGGDTTTGLGYAFDVDNRLKDKAGNDPAKLRTLREQYLKSIAPAAGPSAEMREKQTQHTNGEVDRLTNQLQTLIQERADDTSGNKETMAARNREITRAEAALRAASARSPAKAPPAAKARIAAPAGVPTSTPEERANLAKTFGATDASRSGQVLRTMGPGGLVARDQLGNDLSAYFDRDKPLQARIASTVDANSDNLLVPPRPNFRQY